MRTIMKKRMGLNFLAICVILSANSAVAVESNTPIVDSGTPVVGSGTPVVDSGTPVVDSNTVAVIADGNDASGRGSLENRLSKTISIEFRKTAIEDVLRIVADQADVDIVKSPKVTGEVTVTLTDVPLEEALNNILTVHGFTYVLSQNMIRVITSAEQAEKPEVLYTKTFEIVYADVTEVVKALEKFKSPKGSVSFIKGTSHVIVTDTENQIREITLFIEKIDIMTKQVLVEARIYDITSTDNYDLGVNWELGRNTTYAGGLGTNPTAGHRNPFAISGFSTTNAASDTTTGLVRFGWLNSGIDLDVLLTAEKEKINAKLLANPRILVLDNEDAKIDIISEIPFQKLNQGGGNTQSFGTTEFKEVGIKLTVTPHIAARDEMIRLKLMPEFSIQTGTVNVGDSAATTYPQPVVDTRKADTTLLIKNGMTVVLGGMRKKNVTKQINKIPVLGDIPVAGNLFKFKSEETVLSEIVVFITPWIIEEPIMNSDEQKAYESTEFPGPRPVMTKAEEEAEK
jgi:type IV pilus assembly protein PilQ